MSYGGSNKYQIFPETTQAMSSELNRGNLHFSFFAIATIGWILALASMGQVDWRVWHVDNMTPVISSGIVWVGIWKVCFHSTTLHSAQGTSGKICHTYGRHNSFLPPDFRAVEKIFLLACILGVIGKVCSIIALRNFYMGVGRKPIICNPFTMAGFSFLSAGICVLICVIWNFHSVSQKKTINFPATFYIPPSPNTQESGSAVVVAIISAILMMLSGVFFLSYKFHMDSQVHPMITVEEWASESDL
ncbi:claudin-34-like isoform X1 [Notamacropus eugenii]|uniref:claudin-34-like isoform X1 n=2 Tax=Notamacropus eugenii TaxID=9315 RepID=UPI003B67AAFC